MSNFNKIIIQSNFNSIKPIISQKQKFPKNASNAIPKITINEIYSPRLRTVKSTFPKNSFFDQGEIMKFEENYSSNNHKIVYNISDLTINYNTYLTNFNFINNFNNSLNDLKNDNLKNYSMKKREPKDTIKEKEFKLKKKSKDEYAKRKSNIIKNNSNKFDSNNSKNKIKIINEKNNNSVEVQYIKIPKMNKKIEPFGILNLSEFTQLNQIGKGTFGKIFCVIWKKNNLKYALKKEIFKDIEYVEKRQNIIQLINSFLATTKSKGVIQIYSSFCKKIKDNYYYYELMEKGELDWEKEINIRRNANYFYSEDEIFNIASQLIKTLSLLQNNHITHRDIKPQNIIIVKGLYKICDLGEIRNMKGDGKIIQRIRGSELYMSPILFYGLRKNLNNVKHNTYKSDVFSLGMCLLYASTLYFNCSEEIRELVDMEKINITLNKYLCERYSQKLISLLYLMLQIEEGLRPDFNQLENQLHFI